MVDFDCNRVISHQMDEARMAALESFSKILRGTWCKTSCLLILTSTGEVRCGPFQIPVTPSHKLKKLIKPKERQQQQISLYSAKERENCGRDCLPCIGLLSHLCTSSTSCSWLATPLLQCHHLRLQGAQDGNEYQWLLHVSRKKKILVELWHRERNIFFSNAGFVCCHFYAARL